MVQTLTALHRIGLAGTVWTLLLAGLLSLEAADEPVWPLAALTAIDVLPFIAAAAIATVVIVSSLQRIRGLVLALLAVLAVLAYLPFAGVAWPSHLVLGALLASPVAVLVRHGDRVALFFALLSVGVAALTLTTGAMQGAGGDLPVRLAIMGVLMTAAVIATLLFGSLGRRPRSRTDVSGSGGLS